MSAEAGPPGDQNSCGAKPRRLFADPTKEYAISCLSWLVLDGIAEWDMRDNGDIELRFKNGETHLLGDKVVTRTV
jgi:hypothetical protein